MNKAIAFAFVFLLRLAISVYFFAWSWNFSLEYLPKVIPEMYWPFLSKAILYLETSIASAMVFTVMFQSLGMVFKLALGLAADIAKSIAESSTFNKLCYLLDKNRCSCKALKWNREFDQLCRFEKEFLRDKGNKELHFQAFNAAICYQAARSDYLRDRRLKCLGITSSSAKLVDNSEDSGYSNLDHNNGEA